MVVPPPPFQWCCFRLYSLSGGAAWPPSFGRAAFLLLFWVVLVPRKKHWTKGRNGASSSTQRMEERQHHPKLPLLSPPVGGAAGSLSPSLTRYNTRCLIRSCHGGNSSAEEVLTDKGEKQQATRPHTSCRRPKEKNSRQHVRRGSADDQDRHNNRQHVRTGGVDDQTRKTTSNASAQEN